MKDEQENAVAPGPDVILHPSSFSHFPAIPPPVKVSLVTLGPQPCPYLPDRTSESRALWAEQMPADVYHRFMDAGFRRSGKVVYQPVCGRCRACVPIRVVVDSFQPSKSQRRCRRRNDDVAVTIGEPVATDENYDLYRRYVQGRHHRPINEESRQSFERFLYDSPVDSAEFTYRDAAGRLVAVGICDLSERSLSSVYFYFDPQESRRGLGTFGALIEIETAARLGIPYYYLGYWVDGCRSMLYKAEFRPAEVLWPDAVWRPLDTGSSAACHKVRDAAQAPR